MLVAACPQFESDFVIASDAGALPVSDAETFADVTPDSWQGTLVDSPATPDSPSTSDGSTAPDGTPPDLSTSDVSTPDGETATCAAGTTECASGTQVKTCGADGQWGATTTCANVCVDSGVGSNCGGVCAPGATQCSTGTQVETCRSDGQWGAPTACPYVCVGTSLGSNCGGACTPGAVQCYANYPLSTASGIETCGSNGQWAVSMYCNDGQSCMPPGFCE
jgi:hypothetical protein